MNTSESLLGRAEEKAEATGQEQKIELDAELVELGKVTETKGGFLGFKLDTGAGLLVY